MAAAGALPGPPSPTHELHTLPAVQLFLPLLACSTAGFTVCDEAGRYVYVSDSMSKLVGFSADTMLGCAAAPAPVRLEHCARCASARHYHERLPRCR
jgi:hypothetical protein